MGFRISREESERLDSEKEARDRRREATLTAGLERLGGAKAVLEGTKTEDDGSGHKAHAEAGLAQVLSQHSGVVVPAPYVEK